MRTYCHAGPIEVGDDPFFWGMRRFYAEWRFKKAGTDDFRSAMEATTGRDLGAFFEAWIHGAAIPRVAFGYRSPDANTIAVKLEHRGDFAPVPITITVTYMNGETDNFVVPVTEKSVERTLTLKPKAGAIKKVEAKRRTPVFVLYEIAMILTDGKEGGGPDIDQEKYRQNLKSDPQSAINDRWDPSGLWIEALQDNDGVLALRGAARDASDLTEFTRRLRASARFSDLTNADYQRDTAGKNEDAARFLTWTLDVGVKRWN